MAQKQSGKARARAELLINDIEEEIISLKRVIALLNDILPGMYAEFETLCNQRIEQVANAVSYMDASLPPAAEQANA